MAKIMLGSIAFIVQLAYICQTAQSMVIPYPRVPGDRTNSDFPSVEVNGVHIDTVGTDLNVGYAHFAFEGTVTVEVNVRETINSFDLSPHRYGIHATANGKALLFQISRPRKLHLKINNLARFFIFADALEVDPTQLGQPGVYDLGSYEVLSSLDSVQTRKIQRAIDDVASKKGILYVPPGIYRSGELKVKSDLTLYLAPGAIIKGTGEVEDYPRGEFGTQLIYMLDCQNVKIRGRGVIDGQGRALRFSTNNSSDGRMKLIRSRRARDCMVGGVILRDAGTWAVHLIESEDLRFNDYKLISNTPYDDSDFPWEMNTDGFDPDNSSHIIIENGFVSCGDDAIAVKLRYGNRSDMDDIQFRNNVVWTVKSALKIGTEVYDKKMTNVIFENNEVIYADRGIVVYCYRGATIENPRWINNYFEFIGGNIKRMHMEIKIQDNGGKGYLNDVLIKNNTFERISQNQSRLRGLDNTHVINGITLDNLVIAGKKCMSLEDGQILTNKYVRNILFK
jgi:hypothetical protein